MIRIRSAAIAGGCRVETIGDAKELPIKMVETPTLIVGLSRTAEGITGLVKRHSHLGAGGEAASDADRADRVQPVSVLQDLALDGFGHDST